MPYSLDKKQTIAFNKKAARLSERMKQDIADGTFNPDDEWWGECPDEAKSNYRTRHLIQTVFMGRRLITMGRDLSVLEEDLSDATPEERQLWDDRCTKLYRYTRIRRKYPNRPADRGYWSWSPWHRQNVCKLGDNDSTSPRNLRHTSGQWGNEEKRRELLMILGYNNGRYCDYYWNHSSFRKHCPDQGSLMTDRPLIVKDKNGKTRFAHKAAAALCRHFDISRQTLWRWATGAINVAWEYYEEYFGRDALPPLCRDKTTWTGEKRRGVYYHPSLRIREMRRRVSRAYLGKNAEGKPMYYTNPTIENGELIETLLCDKEDTILRSYVAGCEMVDFVPRENYIGFATPAPGCGEIWVKRIVPTLGGVPLTGPLHQPFPEDVTPERYDESTHPSFISSAAWQYLCLWAKHIATETDKKLERELAQFQIDFSRDLGQLELCRQMIGRRIDNGELEILRTVPLMDKTKKKLEAQQKRNEGKPVEEVVKTSEGWVVKRVSNRISKPALEYLDLLVYDCPLKLMRVQHKTAMNRELAELGIHPGMVDPLRTDRDLLKMDIEAEKVIVVDDYLYPKLILKYKF